MAGLFLFPLAFLALERAGGKLARAFDRRFPILPLVDPPPEPPPPRKPSLLNAILTVVLGGLCWGAVAVIVRLALIRLEGSPAVLIVWAGFLALAAWSLARAFFAHLRPPAPAPWP